MARGNVVKQVARFIASNDPDTMDEQNAERIVTYIQSQEGNALEVHEVEALVKAATVLEKTAFIEDSPFWLSLRSAVEKLKANPEAPPVETGPTVIGGVTEEVETGNGDEEETTR